MLHCSICCGGGGCDNALGFSATICWDVLLAEFPNVAMGGGSITLGTGATGWRIPAGAAAAEEGGGTVSVLVSGTA